MRQRGCEKPTAKPRAIGPAEVKINRCPMSYLRSTDTDVVDVLQLAADYEHGLLPGWPDALAGRLTEGVRFVRGHRDAAVAARMEA